MIKVTTTRTAMESVYEAAEAKLLSKYDQSLYDGLVDIRVCLGMNKLYIGAELYLNNLILESKSCYKQLDL
jgi:hypothetical protein